MASNPLKVQFQKRFRVFIGGQKLCTRFSVSSRSLKVSSSITSFIVTSNRSSYSGKSDFRIGTIGDVVETVVVVVVVVEVISVLTNSDVFVGIGVAAKSNNQGGRDFGAESTV